MLLLVCMVTFTRSDQLCLPRHRLMWSKRDGHEDMNPHLPCKLVMLGMPRH